MKIMYINLLKKKNENKDEEVLMKDLREKKISDFFEEIKHKKIRNIHNNKNNKFFNKLKNFNNNNIVKKNQLTLFVLSLMLVTAGYMNYTNNLKKIKKARLGDSTFVSTNIAKTYDNEESSEEHDEQQIEKNLSNDIETSNSQNSLNTIETSNSKNNSNTIETVDNQNNSNTMETSKSISTEENENTAKKDNNQENQSDITDNYFASTRLERDKSYSQMLETYTNILKDGNVPSDQKTIASNEIKKINDRKNQITTIENLLKGKEIEDSVIMINDNSIDVIVKSNNDLSKSVVAQIENIVSRELNADIEDIHITTHK